MPKPTLDKDELLKRADKALSCCREVLRKLKDNGDHYEYTGGMNTVEFAKESMESYVGYKITGQK